MSKVQGEVVAKKRKYESEADLRAEGRALLTTDEDEDLNESNAKGELVAEPKKRKYESETELWSPSSPTYSPTEPVYKRRPNNKSIILALPAERAQQPWADNDDGL